MFKHVCECCQAEFESVYRDARFCSTRCSAMESHKVRHAKYEAAAKKHGMTCAEYRRWQQRERSRRLREEAKGMGMTVRAYKDFLAHNTTRWHTHPKTYAQIKAENRARGSVAGWRGAPVMGGGHVANWRDPMFEIAEV